MSLKTFQYHQDSHNSVFTLMKLLGLKNGKPRDRKGSLTNNATKYLQSLDRVAMDRRQFKRTILIGVWRLVRFLRGSYVKCFGEREKPPQLWKMGESCARRLCKLNTIK